MNAPPSSPLLEVQQNTGPALLLLVDGSGVPIALNRSARQFFLQKERIAWADILQCDDLVVWNKRLAESLTSQTQISGWFRLRRFDHAIRQFVLRAEPRYDVEGTFAGFLVSGLDVSELGGEVGATGEQTEACADSSSQPGPPASSSGHELAKQWHDSLVKDATVLGAATDVLRDFIASSPTQEPLQLKALSQIERAAEAICVLVGELNSLSRRS